MFIRDTFFLPFSGEVDKVLTILRVLIYFHSLQAAVPHVTNQLRLLWHGRMVRLLFADLYQQEGLDESGHPTTPSTSPSSLSSKQKRIQPSEQTAGERRSVEGLLPANPPSFVSRRSGNAMLGGGRFSGGLTAFLRQLNSAVTSSSGNSSSRQKFGASTGKIPNYAHHQSRPGPGPEDLPRSIKAVCMLYCFTIGSLKEIRNDILAGKCNCLKFTVIFLISLS